MSRVFIRRNKNGDFGSINLAVAYDGFKQLGFEVVHYESINEIVGNEPEDIVVGCINDVRGMLSRLNKTYPTLEYPEQLSSFLGRKLWTCKLSEIVNNPEKWNVFIKPVLGGKLFTGRAIRSIKDLRACTGMDLNIDVWCAELVNFVSEWRCFIRYGELIIAKNYTGDWSKVIDKKVVEQAILTYKDAPNAYVLDFGITDKGETLLVEVNEGYSVGCYGLEAITYAKFLSARWAELTGTEDVCNF